MTLPRGILGMMALALCITASSARADEVAVRRKRW